MKYLVLLSLFLGPYLSPAQSLSNQAVVEKIFLEAWNRKDLSNVREYMTDTVSFHFNNFHFKTHITELEQLIEQWHAAFENFRFEIINIVSDGNMVAINLRFTGKHVGEFMGIAPKHNDINVSEMMFFRFDEGKVVEAWELYDENSMVSQMTGDQ